MNFNINDFLEYANTGTAPTVYSRQQPAKKATTLRPRPTVATATIPRPVVASVQPTPKNLSVMPAQASKPALELVMYSERSFAIFGDTKPLQDQLEGLCGKFNRYLKRDGIVTPGYIFSITRLDKVKKTLSL